ncbi:MAG: hypothetical protein LQ340_006000 [Diploschistes diacapsis]|nr:MAG: hypothetical protein LQ340_006000 [Diploschistes diacapsis]
MPKRRAEELEEPELEAVSTPQSKRTRRVTKATPTSNTPTKATPVKATLAEKLEKVHNGASTLQCKTPTKSYTTPKSVRAKDALGFSTPTNANGKGISTTRNADKSARKKSTRRLLARTIAEDESDEDLGEYALAQEIWNEGSEDGSSAEGEDEQPGDEAVAETPSRRGPGRPKGATRKRTPTPPPNLPPHERYFFENRQTAAKSSANTLSATDIISHSAYHESISNYEDPHGVAIENLHEHHQSSFPLWAFELSQQFSVCLYGYGSKRRILTSFATHLHSLSSEQPPKIIIVNGQHPTLTLRSLLNTIATAVLPPSHKLSTQPTALSSQILAHLDHKPPSSPIYLLLSALQTKPLTAPQSLSILSQLASHSTIHLLATFDNPSFSLIFPAPLRSTFNFVFHDATTFLPYDTGAADCELGTVVDTVLELIGRKSSAVTGREGVRWVLKSLPENARGLYRVLISEILASADADGEAFAFHGGPERPLDEEPDLLDGKREGQGEQRGRKGGASGGLPGIDAKVLYQKAVEEFLCSSEMMFWSLLKEFVDHRMVIVRRERGVGGGGEMLGVELGREELEGVLEDLLE